MENNNQDKHEQPDVTQEETTDSLDEIIEQECRRKQEKADAYEDHIKARNDLQEIHLEEISGKISLLSQQLNQAKQLNPYDHVLHQTIGRMITDLQNRTHQTEQDALKDIILLEKEWLSAKEEFERCKRLRKL